MTGNQMSGDAEKDAVAVAEANAEFYAAFERGDIDAMEALWHQGPEALCIHPGVAPVKGTGPINRSWALIMANTPYIQFFLTDVAVSVLGDVASVTCTENVLTADAQVDRSSFNGGKAVATNVFVRAGDTWRLWIHHASPVMSAEHHED